MKIEIITEDSNEELTIRIHCKEVNNEVERLINSLKNSSISLMGKLDGESVVIDLKDIYYFEAVENKVFAYLETQVYEVEYKIAELNDLLKSTSFIQIARTVVLNLDKIKKIKTMVNGRILAELNNEEKIIITRVYANEFKKKIRGGKR